jgi:thiamine kinase-like enzyme
MNGINLLNWLRPNLRFEQRWEESTTVTRKDKRKTRKGAKHKVGTHFLGRNLMGISPAQFRRFSKASRREAKAQHKAAIASRRLVVA